MADTSDPAPAPAQIPADLGGYQLLRELYPDQTWLARAPGGRSVALKILDADCLLRGQLHPSVRDRLARVRELAHTGVAHLHSVERDAGRTYMVWEYVEGLSLEQWAATSQPGPQLGRRDLPHLARELILAVQTLHARGIVHGAIHGRNIFLTPAGRLRLTHVSPFLYHDVADDVGPLIDLLRALAAAKGSEGLPLAHLLDEAAQTRASLDWLSARVAALLETQKLSGSSGPEGRGDALRRRASLAMAALVAVAAVGVYYGIKWAIKAP
jgi:serine/threonine protein kinase